MAVNLSPVFGAAGQLFDNNGNPLAGGKIYTYLAGTTTNAATYTSSSGSIAHSNPIVLDGAGRVPSGEIWLTNGIAYKFVVEDAASNLIGTYDNLNTGADDACEIPYDPPVVQAVTTVVCNKLAEIISVKDYGAVGDGTTDDSAAIQNAIDDVLGRVLFFPAGTYLIESPITAISLSNFAIVGQDKSAVTIKCDGTTPFASIPLDFQSCTNFSISGITFDQNNNASLTATFPLIRYVSSDQAAFQNNKIINHTFIGLAVDSCTNFYIKQNYIRKTAQANTINYNINVSSSVSVSEFGYVQNNYVENSGIGAVGSDIVISGNTCQGTKYGAGIATFSLGGSGTTPGNFYGRYTIQSNTCINANGTDIDGFKCCGMEIAGPQSLIQNNVSYGNDGEGIRLFAYQSICSGNIVYNNGKGLAGTYTQGGIVTFWSAVDPTYSASYSLIEGNHCFDTGGGTQLYGYAEQSTSLTGMQITGNNFDNNVTGPWLLAVTSGNSYDLDYWFSYTPVITATSGTLTAGTCTGKYIRKGKTVFFQANCPIANNGTGAVAINITLPINSSAIGNFAILGRANVISGKTLTGVVIASSNVVTVTDYNAVYPGATGETILISGWYAT